MNDPLIKVGDWIVKYFAVKRDVQAKAKEFRRLFGAYYQDFMRQPDVVYDSHNNQIRTRDQRHVLTETGILKNEDFTDLPEGMVVTCEQRNRRIVHLDEP